MLIFLFIEIIWDTAHPHYTLIIITLINWKRENDKPLILHATIGLYYDQELMRDLLLKLILCKNVYSSRL